MQVYTPVPIPPAADAAEQAWRHETSDRIMNMTSAELAEAITQFHPGGGVPVRLVP